MSTFDAIHYASAQGAASPVSAGLLTAGWAIFGHSTPEEVDKANDIAQADKIVLAQLLATEQDVQEYVIDLEDDIEELKFTQEEEKKRLEKKQDEILVLCKKVNSNEGTEDDKKALNEMIEDYNNDTLQSNSILSGQQKEINNTNASKLKQSSEVLSIAKAHGKLSEDYGKLLMQTHVSSGFFSKLTGKSDNQQMIVDAGTDLVMRSIVINTGISNVEELNEKIRQI